MKTTIYYLILLVVASLITGFLLAGKADLTTSQFVITSLALILYTIALALVGEAKTTDEREIYHRHVSTKIAFVTAISFLSLGAIVQLYLHHLDYWLLAGLLVINLSKIISLIWLNAKR